MYTEQLTQGLSLADQINPANYAAATYNSTGIDMQKFHRALFVLEIGVMAAGSTVNVVLQSSATSNFATAHNLTTTPALTQITNTTPNCVLSVEASAEAVANQNAGDRYLRLQVIVGTAAVYFGALGLGGEAPFKPASAQNNTTVVVQQAVAN